jgi:hypothetical protein
MTASGGGLMVATEGSADRAYVLSIGAVYGGPEFSHQPAAPWRGAIQALAQRVATVRDGVQSSLNLNVVFHVPGSILVPDFTGARTGSFRKRDSHLMVQVALPPDAPEDQAGYLTRALLDSLQQVDIWNQRKDRRFDLSAIRSVVERL